MSDSFVPLMPVTSLAPGMMRCVEIAGQRVLVANVDGEFLATSEMCTHEDALLCTGSLHGEEVKCPLHGARFNLRTGAALDEPAEEALKCYPVRIVNDTVYIDLRSKP